MSFVVSEVVGLPRQGSRACVLLACVLFAPLAAWPHATQLSSSRMELAGHRAGVLLELNGRDLEVALHTTLTAPDGAVAPERLDGAATAISAYLLEHVRLANSAGGSLPGCRSSPCARGASMCWRRCAGVARRSPARSSTGSRCSTRSIRQHATCSPSPATCDAWPCSATLRRKRRCCRPVRNSSRSCGTTWSRARAAHRHRAASTSPSSLP